MLDDASIQGVAHGGVQALDCKTNKGDGATDDDDFIEGAFIGTSDDIAPLFSSSSRRNRKFNNIASGLDAAPQNAGSKAIVDKRLGKRDVILGQLWLLGVFLNTGAVGPFFTDSSSLRPWRSSHPTSGDWVVMVDAWFKQMLTLTESMVFWLHIAVPAEFGDYKVSEVWARLWQLVRLCVARGTYFSIAVWTPIAR